MKNLHELQKAPKIINLYDIILNSIIVDYNIRNAFIYSPPEHTWPTTLQTNLAYELSYTPNFIYQIRTSNATTV